MVVADDLLDRVSSNLLSNAVEHNERDSPTVSVTVDAGGDDVVVSVADDGPDVPQ